MNFKRIAAAVAVAGALVGTAQIVEAYPPEAPEVTPSDPTPAAGGSFTVSAQCVVPETVRFTFEGETKDATCQPTSSGGLFPLRLPMQTPTFDGIATATFSAPNAVGSYTVVAVGLSSGFETSTTITVEQAPTSVPLPPTGGGDSAGNTVAVAGGLLLVGAGMFAVAETRRRRAHRAA